MNTEEIIKLARKVGGYDGFTSPPTDWDEGDFVISPEALLKFATLVRNEALEALKAENEALRAEVERLRAEVERLRADRDSWEQQASDRVADWYAEHIRAERLAEAARACKDLDEEALCKEGRLASGHECVSAIRAMKEHVNGTE